MRRIWVRGMMVVVAGMGAAVFGGAPGPMPMSPKRIMEQADAILEVTVGEFVADGGRVAAPVSDPRPAGWEGQDWDTMVMMVSRVVRPAGTYTFKVGRCLKGDVKGELKMHVPAILTFYYDQSDFALPVGRRALLFLKKGERQEWGLVDAMMPLMPLGEAPAAGEKGGGEAKKTDALDLLVESLADAKLRLVVAYFLSEIEDARVATAMSAYKQDKDLKLRANVLTCMAVNQDVAAIPLIGELASEMERTHFGSSGPNGALMYFKTPKAVEYLNPLIAEGTDYTRMNALQALSPIADKSSVPFLIKALHRRDDRLAYRTLERLIGNDPALMQIERDLGANGITVQALDRWWEAEQAKAAKAAATTTAPASQAGGGVLPRVAEIGMMQIAKAVACLLFHFDVGHAREIDRVLCVAVGAVAGVQASRERRYWGH